MSNDLWRTPDWLYLWLNELYGPFDIDLAASAENAKCASFLTVQQDSIEQPWHQLGSNGFCNPPYSNLSPWLWKANNSSLMHNFRSTLILPAWNGEKFWRWNLFQQSACKETTQIYGRVGFIDPVTTKEVKGNRAGTIIAHYDGVSRTQARQLHADRDELIKQYG